MPRPPAREPLPVAPLLAAYVRPGVPHPSELAHLPGLGPRLAAIRSATACFLSGTYLDSAREDELRTSLERFYTAVVDPPLHLETVRRRAGFLRHALAYLVRGRDPLSVKADQLLRPGGAYHISGLGPSFWSAAWQGLHPTRLPGWTPATVAGLSRLSLDRWAPGAAPSAVYSALDAGHTRLRSMQPALTALHVDHFLSLVATMSGRNLYPAEGEGRASDPAAAARDRLRAEQPLRAFLKERGAALARGQAAMEAALAQQDGKAIGLALAEADAGGWESSPLDWGRHGETLTLWVGRLWEADDPYPILSAFWAADPLPGAGLWLPGAVLHLRDPQTYLPWGDDVRRGLALLDDAIDGLPPAACYRLANEAAAALRFARALHPLEVPAILASLGRESASPTPRRSTSTAVQHARSGAAGFGGFCPDTFDFLAELAADNNRDWMDQQRERYRFAVRGPLVELCRALAARYIRPVLHGVHGWELDVEARSGRALTSVCKNAFGRGGPYNTELWIAFCERTAGVRRDAAPQLFVRLDAAGLQFGFRSGRPAWEARERLRDNVRRHSGSLVGLLADSGCAFGPADGPGVGRPLASEADLLDWTAGRSFQAARRLAADDPRMADDALVGEILLTFDRLLPLYACAREADAERWLARRGCPDAAAEEVFCRDTFLGADWLRRARALLGLKRQLILQGVPGTGKTHVARCLARALTVGRADAVRLVQFHPAYSYEEFVEGVKVRSVAVGGRHDVTYPVEDGLLRSFAADAASRPGETFVLLIDEINRGNLPRIFGELLYLLEYRGQEVILPYSRTPFRLPDNLYLLGTMNAGDRSAVLLDQALRRRFSLLEMPPDAGVLAGWLASHPPPDGPAFAERVVALFGRLNQRLQVDLGPQARVGHSYFMVPGLDEARLRVVWDHHVRPQLADHFAARPDSLAAYDLDSLLADTARAERRRTPVS